MWYVVVAVTVLAGLLSILVFKHWKRGSGEGRRRLTPRSNTTGPCDVLLAKEGKIGLAIVIANEYIALPEGQGRLVGTARDKERWEKLLKELEFDVLTSGTKGLNVSRDEMLDLIELPARIRVKNEDVSTCCRYIVFVFSGHGYKDGIVSEDLRKLSLQSEVIPLLFCERLYHFKKLIFIDACRNDIDGSGKKALKISKGILTKGTSEDVSHPFEIGVGALTAYATLDRLATPDSNEGSDFSKFVTEWLRENATITVALDRAIEDVVDKSSQYYTRPMYISQLSGEVNLCSDAMKIKGGEGQGQVSTSSDSDSSCGDKRDEMEVQVSTSSDSDGSGDEGCKQKNIPSIRSRSRKDQNLKDKRNHKGLKEKPSQKNLDKISKKAGDNWRTLLTQLGLEVETIEEFHQNTFDNISEACFKGLTHWLGGNADKPVTWEKLLMALRESSMVGIADDWEEVIKGHRRKGQVSTSSDSEGSSEDELKAALESDYYYWKKNLTVDNELAAKLYEWNPQFPGDPLYGCPDPPLLYCGISPQSGHVKATNPHVEKLREHAYDQYKLLKIGEGIKMEYIKLTLLSTDPTVRGKDKKDLNNFLQHYRTCGVEPLEEVSNAGELNDFLLDYWTCDIEPFGVGSNVEPTKLLRRTRSKVRVIYGHAGIGKTSLLKQVCHTLADRKAGTDYELVLYFPLRDKLVSQAKTLKELLPYYGSEDENVDYSKATQSLIDNKGCNTLFVFDGADEVRELLESEDTSAFRKILQGKVLPKASIIVTSRPGGIPNLQELTPEFYEVHGFNKASMKSYITEFFKDHPGEGVKMLEELRSRADLIGGAHIPVNLFIFCSIYRDGGFPATITLCYEHFTCHGMSRNSERTSCSKPSFRLLPGNEQTLLKALGKLAFEGLKKTPSVYVFEEEELSEIFSDLLTADNIMDEAFFRGLLHHHSSRRGCLLSNTYNFSHTTNQEFFSAFFLSKLPEDEQLTFLAENFTNPKYSMVVRFYSGLTGLSSERITSFLCQPDHQSPSSHTLSSLQMLSQGNCVDSELYLLFLCHSLYESQNSIVTENIVNHLSDSLSFHLILTPHDLLALRYALGKCTHLKSLLFVINAYIPSISDVLPILNSNRSLKYLELVVESLSSEDVRNLSSVASLKTLHLIVLSRTTLSAVSAIFRNSTIKYLHLNIRCPVTGITLEHKSELSRLVSANTALETLTLHVHSQDYLLAVLHGLGTKTGSITTNLDVKCDDLSVEDVRNLSSVASLERLDLTVRKRTTLSTLSTIFSSSTIKDLKLSIRYPLTDISHEHKSELSRLVAANTALKKLTLDGCSQDYMSAVLHVLGTSAGSITDLVVKCDELSVEDVKNLNSRASLERLSLALKKITRWSTLSVIFSSSTIKDLKLSIMCPLTDITHEHKSELSRLVSANTALKKLTLFDCSQGYMSAVLYVLGTSAGSITDLVVRCDELSVEDGKNLSSVTSLETLLLTVRNRTTQSALSTIFGSSTINVLKLSIKCPLTDISHKHKSELSRLVAANTALKKLTLDGCSQDYMSAVLHVLGTSAGSITDLVVKCDELSVEDGRSLSSVASLETLDLTVEKVTTLLALSAIFGSSTINDLKLSIKCSLTDITHEYKSELSRLVSANTALKKLTLHDGSQDYMSAVLRALGTSAGSITYLAVWCGELFVEGGRNLSSVASLETLHLTVRRRTTLSALSEIFGSSTIKDLHLSIDCSLTDITHEHKSELSRLVSANTTLKKLTLFSYSQDYISAVLHGLGTSAGSITDLVVECDELSVEDGRNLSSVASLETLILIVKRITLSALSAIFGSSTMKDLYLSIESPLTDITHEHKSELSCLVSANTALKKLTLQGCSQDYMSAVLHVLGTSSGSITDLIMYCGELSVEGCHDVAEALATTCAVNTNLKRVSMAFLPLLPVMKSLTNRKTPLDELRIKRRHTLDTDCSEEFLTEVERAAAEIGAVKIAFDVESNLHVCRAVSAGFGRNPFLKDLTLSNVPRQMEESTMTELSASVKAVRMQWPDALHFFKSYTYSLLDLF